MRNYLHIKKISILRKIAGTLSLIFIILLFLIDINSGLKFILGFFSFFGGLYLASTDGIEIKFDENKFRNIFSIYSINIGFWDTYPKIAYISILKTKVKQKIENKYQPLAASATLTGEIILINLFSETNQIKTLYRTNSKEEAEKIAKHIASFYNIDIKSNL
nr:hypothetical protein [uncultured Flavobacterium sp.]